MPIHIILLIGPAAVSNPFAQAISQSRGWAVAAGGGIAVIAAVIGAIMHMAGGESGGIGHTMLGRKVIRRSLEGAAIIAAAPSLVTLFLNLGHTVK